MVEIRQYGVKRLQLVLGLGARELQCLREESDHAYLAEYKEDADVPKTGLILEEGFQVDILKGLEAADQSDKGLIISIVCDAL